MEGSRATDAGPARVAGAGPVPRPHPVTGRRVARGGPGPSPPPPVPPGTHGGGTRVGGPAPRRQPRPSELIGTALLDDDDDVAAGDGLAGSDLDLGDGARPVGRDGVLHLHRFEDDDGLTRLDLLADLDEHLHDRSLHRHRHLAAAGDDAAGACSSSATGTRAGAGAGTGRGQRGDGDVGHPQLHAEAPAVDLDVDLSLDLGDGGPTLIEGRRTDGRRLETRQVESLLDPLRRMRRGAEVGVLEDGDVGRDRRRDPGDAELPEGAEGPGDRRRSIAAPHDQLADEVVVELADLVAGLVAAVPAHTEPLRGHERGDRPGRREEAPAGRVLGVHTDLDGVASAGVDEVALGERQWLARRHPQLLGDEVDAGDELGHRVLYL